MDKKHVKLRRRKLGRFVAAPKKWHLVPAIIALAVVSIGVFYIVSSRAAGNAVVYLTPASGNATTGQDFTVTVMVNTNGEAVNAVAANVTYPIDRFDFISIDSSTSSFNTEAYQVGGNGAVAIERAHNSTTPLTGTLTVGRIVLRPKTTGTATLNFATNTHVIRAADNTEALGSTTPATYTLVNPPDTTPPSVPTALTAAPSTGIVALTWTASTDNVGVTGYEVRHKLSSATTWNTAVSVSGTSHTYTGLTNGQSYDFAVRARDAAGNFSAWSANISGTPADTTAPSVPTGLAPTPSSSAVSLTWTASTDNVGVTGYEVRHKLNSSTTWNTAVSVTATSHTYTGLTNGSVYNFAVRARDAAGNFSAWSASVNSTPVDTTPPTAPTALIGLPSHSAVALTWTASTDNVGVTGYEVRHKLSSATTWNTAVSVSGTSHTYTGLTNGQSYDFAVRARDAAGNFSAWSANISGTPQSKPGDITGAGGVADGLVNSADLAILLANYRKAGLMTLAQGDLNGDGTVNAFDLSVMLSNWTR